MSREKKKKNRIRLNLEKNTTFYMGREGGRERNKMYRGKGISNADQEIMHDLEV